MSEMKNEGLNELNIIGLEKWNYQNGRDYAAISEAQNEINSRNIDDGYLDYVFQDEESFATMLENNGIMDEFLVECYSQLVFPLWYSYWNERGIDKARDTIEKIYRLMESSSDIGGKVSAVNLALNAVHMGGSMLDCVENSGLVDIRGDLVKELSDLTDGKYIPEWDSSLRDIGVKI
jgi:hypothetical protein